MRGRRYREHAYSTSPVIRTSVGSARARRMRHCAAEREGFEPSVRLRAHMISNHAPSATRSSLRVRANRKSRTLATPAGGAFLAQREEEIASGSGTTLALTRERDARAAVGERKRGNSAAVVARGHGDRSGGSAFGV